MPLKRDKFHTSNASKQASLAEDVKIARHLLDTERMHATEEWALARVAEQEAAIQKANSEIARVWEAHKAAAGKLAALRLDLKNKEGKLYEHVNRGELNQVEDRAKHLVEMINKLKARMSPEELAVALAAAGLQNS